MSKMFHRIDKRAETIQIEKLEHPEKQKLLKTLSGKGSKASNTKVFIRKCLQNQKVLMSHQLKPPKLMDHQSVVQLLLQNYPEI
jgi:hypothetical protein